MRVVKEVQKRLTKSSGWLISGYFGCSPLLCFIFLPSHAAWKTGFAILALGALLCCSRRISRYVYSGQAKQKRRRPRAGVCELTQPRFRFLLCSNLCILLCFDAGCRRRPWRPCRSRRRFSPSSDLLRDVSGRSARLDLSTRSRPRLSRAELSWAELGRAGPWPWPGQARPWGNPMCATHGAPSCEQRR